MDVTPMPSPPSATVISATPNPPAAELPPPTDLMGNLLPPDRIGVPGRHPSVTGPRGTNPDYENNLNRFRELTGIILDTEGAHSEDEKLEAWTAYHRMAVTGRFVGFGPDERALMNEVGRSETVRNVEAARVRYADAVLAAIREADRSGLPRQEAAGRAALNHYDGLGQLEQKRLFASINAPDYTGATPFADAAGWRRQMMMWAKLFEPIADKLDLSAEAKAVVGDLPPPTRLAGYEPGAKADLMA